MAAIVQFFIVPFLLLGLVVATWRLFGKAGDIARQIFIVAGLFMSSFAGALLAYFNEQRAAPMLSFDPLAGVMSRNAIVALIIIGCAGITLLALRLAAAFARRAWYPLSAAVYALLAVALIYVAYFRVALPAVVVVVVGGALLGVLLNPLWGGAGGAHRRTNRLGITQTTPPPGR
jgi:hypothetical protein